MHVDNTSPFLPKLLSLNNEKLSHASNSLLYPKQEYLSASKFLVNLTTQNQRYMYEITNLSHRKCKY